MEREQFRVNMHEWIKEQKAEYRDNAFYHPNTEYFKVLAEIGQHKDEFVANSGELVRFAQAFSTTYQQLEPDDKEFVSSMLDEEIFSIWYSDDDL
ncbi:hypothetical protein R5Q34_004595 [Salmonella enterica]|nr:hypothetical protein [Salmonella enterica]